MNEAMKTSGGGLSHADALNTLTRADPERTKAYAEHLLDALGPVEVLTSRTGLAMLPYVDTAQNTSFHLGEVMIAEAHIRLPARGVEGYGALTGRDLERAMAIAVIDASLAAEVETNRIEAFLRREHLLQVEADESLLRKVEATRVRMETF